LSVFIAFSLRASVKINCSLSWLTRQPSKNTAADIRNCEYFKAFWYDDEQELRFGTSANMQHWAPVTVFAEQMVHLYPLTIWPARSFY
jgi:hypothetical protein